MIEIIEIRILPHSLRPRHPIEHRQRILVLPYLVQRIGKVHQPLVHILLAQLLRQPEPLLRNDQRRVYPERTVLDEQIAQNIEPHLIVLHIIQRPAKLRNLPLHLLLVHRTAFNHPVQLQKQGIIVRPVRSRRAETGTKQ